MSRSINTSAPDFNPDLWNSKCTAEDYLRLFLEFRRTIEHINALARPMIDSNRDIDAFPIERTKEAMRKVVKLIEDIGDTAKIADILGLSKTQIDAFAPVALQTYEKSGFQEYTNCYTYAMNDRDRFSRFGASPGDRAALVPGAIDYNTRILQALAHKDYDGYKRALIAGLEADGATFAGDHCDGKKGSYLIAIYTRKNTQDDDSDGDLAAFDMHFLREDKTGWSHKPKRNGKVTNLDKDGKVIADPRTANTGYDFLGFAYVPEGGLDVGGSVMEPKTKPHSVEIPDLPERKKVQFGKDIAPFAEPNAKL